MPVGNKEPRARNRPPFITDACGIDDDRLRDGVHTCPCRSMRSNLKPWALALLISVAVPALAMAALIGLAVWAPQDQKVIRAHLADAIASGVINEKVALGVLDAHPTPVYASDCLLFTMMPAPGAGTLPDVLGNTRGESDSQVIDPRVPPYPSCQHLIRAFSEFETDGSDRLRYFPYD